MDESSEREKTEHDALYAEALEQMAEKEKKILADTEKTYLKPVKVSIDQAMIDRVGEAFAFIKACDDHTGQMLLKETLFDKTALMTEVVNLKTELEAANKKIWQLIQACIYNQLTKDKYTDSWGTVGKNLAGHRISMKVGLGT